MVLSEHNLCPRSEVYGLVGLKLVAQFCQRGSQASNNGTIYMVIGHVSGTQEQQERFWRRKEILRSPLSAAPMYLSKGWRSGSSKRRRLSMSLPL